MTPDIAKKIELTNIKGLTSRETMLFVGKAILEGYGAVCIPSGNLAVAAKARMTQDLKLVTVAGFPPVFSYPIFKTANKNPQLDLALGLYTHAEIAKIQGIIDGGLADELDLVFPMFWYTRGKLLTITKFLTGIKKRYNRPLKVICELGTIFKNQINLWEIYQILSDSGVDYFKTNTGLLPQDFESLKANLVLLQMMVADTSSPKLKLKASGGIRTEAQVNQLIAMGVDRIGTSSITAEERV